MFLLILLQLASLSRIANSNEELRYAREASARGNYAAAAKGYSRMVDELGVRDEAALANMAHSFYKAGDLVSAGRAYTRLSLSKEPAMRSLAHTQLGVVAARQKNLAQAALEFKQALREDPNNNIARMNYERVLRRAPEQKPPPPKDKKSKEEQKKEDQKKQQDKQNQQNKDQQQPKDQQQQGQGKDKAEPKPQPGQENKPGKPEDRDQSGKDVSDPQGAGNKGRDPRQDAFGQRATQEQLKKMQIPEEKARMLLDAMRSAEVQYLQQRRYRRSPAADQDKPTW